MIKKLLFGAMLFPLAFSAQQKISITPSVGYSWRTAKVPNGLDQQTEDFVRGVKSGINFDVAAYYHIKNNSSIGLKYSNFSASHSGRLTFIDEYDQPQSGIVNIKDNISFVGVGYMYSNFTDENKHKFLYDIALGLISYKSTLGGVKFTGSNLGLDVNLGYQYAINPKIFIGPKLGYTVGTLTKMKINGVEYDLGDEKEGLGRINLNAAITFNL